MSRGSGTGDSMALHRMAIVALILVGLSLPVYATEPVGCDTGFSSLDIQQRAESPLPVRQGPRVRTSGRVPHVQIGVDPSEPINEKLRRLAFTLPGLEERPTIVSLPGAKGMWLTDEVAISRPKAIVSGREFAHIHTDGSLHAPLPLDRALELEKKGWGERHPWADRFEGWAGLVMLYSATSDEELSVLLQLTIESYMYVTGRSVNTLAC